MPIYTEAFSLGGFSTASKASETLNHKQLHI